MNTHPWSLPTLRSRAGRDGDAPLAVGVCVRMTRERFTALLVAVALVLATFIFGLVESVLLAGR